MGIDIKLDEEKLKKILKDSKPIFAIIDEIGGEMREPTGLNIEYYYTSLDKLSGCYTYLSPLYKKLAAVKTNNEVGKYVTLRKASEDDEKKFVSTAADRESSHEVRDIRLVRNIVEGYLLATENSINTCKKHIGGYEKEHAVSK